MTTNKPGHEELKELWRRRDAARDKYLELRDAKSNGCCHGMTIPEVLRYDEQIMSAAKEVDLIDAEIKGFQAAMDVMGQ